MIVLTSFSLTTAVSVDPFRNSLTCTPQQSSWDGRCQNQSLRDARTPGALGGLGTWRLDHWVNFDGNGRLSTYKPAKLGICVFFLDDPRANHPIPFYVSFLPSQLSLLLLYDGFASHLCHLNNMNYIPLTRELGPLNEQLIVSDSICIS